MYFNFLSVIINYICEELIVKNRKIFRKEFINWGGRMKRNKALITLASAVVLGSAGLYSLNTSDDTNLTNASSHSSTNTVLTKANDESERPEPGNEKIWDMETEKIYDTYEKFTETKDGKNVEVKAYTYNVEGYRGEFISGPLTKTHDITYSLKEMNPNGEVKKVIFADKKYTDRYTDIVRIGLDDYDAGTYLLEFVAVEKKNPNSVKVAASTINLIEVETVKIDLKLDKDVNPTKVDVGVSSSSNLLDIVYEIYEEVYAGEDENGNPETSSALVSFGTVDSNDGIDFTVAGNPFSDLLDGEYTFRVKATERFMNLTEDKITTVNKKFTIMKEKTTGITMDRIINPMEITLHADDSTYLPVMKWEVLDKDNKVVLKNDEGETTSTLGYERLSGLKEGKYTFKATEYKGEGAEAVTSVEKVFHIRDPKLTIKADEKDPETIEATVNGVQGEIRWEVFKSDGSLLYSENGTEVPKAYIDNMVNDTYKITFSILTDDMREASTNYTFTITERNNVPVQDGEKEGWSLYLEGTDITSYYGTKVIELNNNKADFAKEEIEQLREEVGTKGYTFSKLDGLGRQQTYATAFVTDMVDRGEYKLDVKDVSGYPENNPFEKYILLNEVLYSSVHDGKLNAKENVFTSTNTLKNYVNQLGSVLALGVSGNEDVEILVQTKPIFMNNDKIATAFHLKAQSINDNGKAVNINQLIYNVQDGFDINYNTGEIKEVLQNIPEGPNENPTGNDVDPNKPNKPTNPNDNQNGDNVDVDSSGNPIVDDKDTETTVDENGNIIQNPDREIGDLEETTQGTGNKPATNNTEALQETAMKSFVLIGSAMVALAGGLFVHGKVKNKLSEKVAKPEDNTDNTEE